MDFFRILPQKHVVFARGNVLDLDYPREFHQELLIKNSHGPTS